MLKIRAAKAKDIDSCLIAQASEGDKTFSRKDFLRATRNQFVIFLVAELDKKVVGYIMGFIVPTLHKESMVHETMVYKKLRRKGIGFALVKKFILEAHRRNVKVIYAEVEKGYPYEFYKHCGFKKESIWYSMAFRR